MGLTEGVAELRAEDHAQGADRDQERRVLGSQPALALTAEAPGTDQEMDVRMVEQGPSPGVEDGQDGGRGSQPTRVGTVAIAAGVIGVAQQCAVIPLRYMTAEVGGAAVLDVAQRALLTGKQRVSGLIRRTVLADDIRHLDHGRGSEIAQQGVDGVAEGGQSGLGEVGVEGGGAGRTVTQVELPSGALSRTADSASSPGRLESGRANRRAGARP